MKQEEVIASLKEIQRLASICLAAVGEGETTRVKSRAKTHATHATKNSPSVPDFTAQIRHFMNTHAKGMNGQQRFALVVAYLSKGKTDTKVALKTIKEAWNKMKKLLGKFNTGYAVWAKDNGWVDSPELKVYVLMPGWKNILNPNA